MRAPLGRRLPVLQKGNQSLRVRDRCIVAWRIRLDEWLQPSATAERKNSALVDTRDQTSQDLESRLLLYEDHGPPGAALGFSQHLQVRVQTWTVGTCTTIATMTMSMYSLLTVRVDLRCLARILALPFLRITLSVSHLLAI